MTKKILKFPQCVFLTFEIVKIIILANFKEYKLLLWVSKICNLGNLWRPNSTFPNWNGHISENMHLFSEKSKYVLKPKFFFFCFSALIYNFRNKLGSLKNILALPTKGNEYIYVCSDLQPFELANFALVLSLSHCTWKKCHSVEIQRYFCHSDFIWNQFLMKWEPQKL